MRKIADFPPRSGSGGFPNEKLGFGAHQGVAHPLLPIADAGGEGADLGGVTARLEGVAIAGLSAGFAFGFWRVNRFPESRYPLPLWRDFVVSQCAALAHAASLPQVLRCSIAGAFFRAKAGEIAGLVERLLFRLPKLDLRSVWIEYPCELAHAVHLLTAVHLNTLGLKPGKKSVQIVHGEIDHELA